MRVGKRVTLLWDLWRLLLATTGICPAPNLANFSAIRARLYQNVPHRGVFRNINLECDYSTTEQWLWEVKYGIKKISRIRKAIATLNKAIHDVTPCLKSQPIHRTAEKNKQRLIHLEDEKTNKRCFYKLRQSRRAITSNSSNITSVAVSSSNKISSNKSDDKRVTRPSSNLVLTSPIKSEKNSIQTLWREKQCFLTKPTRERPL